MSGTLLPAFLYVIGGDDEPQKIGKSNNPVERLRQPDEQPARPAFARGRSRGVRSGGDNRAQRPCRTGGGTQRRRVVQRIARAGCLGVEAVSGQTRQSYPVLADLTPELALASVQSLVSPAVCRAARALLNWSQDELAKAARVGVNTVRNFEQEKASPRQAILSAMRSAFERAGVMILDEAGEEGVKRRKAAELPPASNIEPA